MNPRVLRSGLALTLLAGPLLAQRDVGDVARPTAPAAASLHLKYATFDPLVAVPQVPPTLRAAGDTGLWIVQFAGTPTDAGRRDLEARGARIVSFLPDDAYVVRMPAGVAPAVGATEGVRWVGPYEPAYRLEPFLVQEHLLGGPVPERRYHLVVADKRQDKPALAQKLLAIGGEVVDEHAGSILFEAALDAGELLLAARFDEVLWIDRWSPPEQDMDNARIQGGADHVETQGGYTGSGVRGHVHEGVESNHPDFNTPLTVVGSTNIADTHGHCTAGIVFGNGTSAPQARGMAPNAVGFFTNYNTVSAGLSRNALINQVVNTHQCMFTTASWGGARTTQYTATSADADDIVFDHRIPWTQSQSNAGNQQSRPEAWAKNVFSIGAVQHFNNATSGDDSWAGGNASTGPASDGRIKPDLCAYYDSIWTSDRTGSAGYSSGNSTQTFGGTSGATPQVAGHNALAIQMYTDALFGNDLRVPGGTRFQNRPLAQTLKALMIATAQQYSFTSASTDNRREHQGWGFPSLRRLHDCRDRLFIVDEDEAISQGETDGYTIRVAAGEPELKVCMTFLEPAGNPASTQARVNDLSLRVTAPNGTVFFGNVGLSNGMFSTAGGSANTLDSVECVFVQNPVAGDWRVEVVATQIVQDAHVATGAVDATYALVACGGAAVSVSTCSRFVPSDAPAVGIANVVPFGDVSGGNLETLFVSNNGGAVGGAVYLDATVSTAIEIAAIDVNTAEAPGTAVTMELWRTASGVPSTGNESNASAWTRIGTGQGICVGLNARTEIVLDRAVRLPVGAYGIALVARGFGFRYTNGTGSNQAFSDSNLALSLGAASNVPFAGSAFTPRVANLRLQYATSTGTSAWRNQLYQTIVRAADLGGAGRITGLAFAPASSGRHYNDEIRVRMSEVPSGWALSATFADNLPRPFTVLDTRRHTWDLVGDTWNEIGLQRSFPYSGRNDLVIEVLAVGNANTLSSGGFRRDTRPRVFAAGFARTPPATGSVGNSALKMRLQFGCGDASTFGVSCGDLRLAFAGGPVLGTSYDVIVREAVRNSVALLNVGLSNDQPLYPWDLTPLGFVGCTFWHDAFANVGVTTDANGRGALTLATAIDPSLIGTRLLFQYVQPDRSQRGGWTFSNYGRAMYGETP